MFRASGFRVRALQGLRRVKVGVQGLCRRYRIMVRFRWGFMGSV